MARVDVQLHSATSLHSHPVLKSAKPMSRLEQMQADLHRKLLQDKEEKMVKLYNDNQNRVFERVNKIGSGGGGSNGYGGGNVRKFFDQRRALGDSMNLDSSMSSLDSYFLNASNTFNASNSFNSRTMRPSKSSPVGWDKSYPLVPIERTNSGSSSGYESISSQHKTPFGVAGGDVRRGNPHLRRQSLDRNRTAAAANVDSRLTMRRSKSQIIDGNLESKEEDMSKASTTSSPIRGRPPAVRENRIAREQEKRKLQLEMRKREQELINKIKEQQAEIERMRQEKMKEEKAQKARLMRKPVPVLSRPIPPVKRQDSSSRSSSASRQSTESNSPVLPSSPVYQPTKPKSATTQPKTAAPKPSSLTSVKPPPVRKENKPPPRRSSANSDLPECKICGRRFAPDRIEKHVSVCTKTTVKKRKVFDPVKMRTQGTEAENFIKKTSKSKEPPKKKSNWRVKHESFLQTIRQAKVMQDHVAAGGKLSDLPPPPPMDTSDYVQCPHCKRKFSEGVADRHIPKCQNIRSNKR